MAFKIVYNWAEYTQLLMHIATDVPTRYKNKFPYNLGYYNGDYRFTWDCWNLYKSIMWGWKENKSVGYYAKRDSSTGLGDWGGPTIMRNSKNVSTDFSKISPAEGLLNTDGTHWGTYVGNFTFKGHTCNVVECTVAFKDYTNGPSGGVIGSWVDTDGTRRAYKGGPKNGKWAKHGQSPCIDYSYEKPKYDKIDVDGWFGSDTINLSCDILGVAKTKITYQGKKICIVQYQNTSNKKYHSRVSGYAWKYNYKKGGDALIVAIQKHVGLTGKDLDGQFGPKSIKAVQTFLKARKLYSGDIDGHFGPGTVKGWQTYINDLAAKK